MKSILDKIYPWDKEKALSDILQCYYREGSCFVNFIYFSNIVSQNLFDSSKRSNSQDDYRKMLLKGDFLLPDGIALQIFYYLATCLNRVVSSKKWLDNLNGTDFSTFFLQKVKDLYGPHKICLLMYWAEESEVQKAKEFISYKGYNVIYFQNGYSEFDWEKAEKQLSEYQDTINVLMVGRSTVTNPIQELWTLKNYQKIKKNNLILLNVWGLFDWWSWKQRRAPQWVRKIKLEWLRRLITDPKRNIQKVWNSLQLFPYLFRYLVLKK